MKRRSPPVPAHSIRIKRHPTMAVVYVVVEGKVVLTTSMGHNVRKGDVAVRNLARQYFHLPAIPED